MSSTTYPRYKNIIMPCVIAKDVTTESSSYAVSASFTTTTISSSYTISASVSEITLNAGVADTGSYMQLAESASYAPTASYANIGFDTNNTLFVDNVNGDDSTAIKGDNTAPYASIQAAYDAADEYDKIVVYSGVYNEDLDFMTGITPFEDPKIVVFDAPNITGFNISGSANISSVKKYPNIRGRLGGFEFIDNGIILHDTGDEYLNGHNLYTASIQIADAPSKSSTYSATNRYTIYLKPAVYNIPTRLFINASYIDYIGLDGMATIINENNNGIWLFTYADNRFENLITRAGGGAEMTITGNSIVRNMDMQGGVALSGGSPFHGIIQNIRSSQLSLGGATSTGLVSNVFCSNSLNLNNFGGVILNCKFKNSSITAGTDLAGYYKSLDMSGFVNISFNGVTISGIFDNVVASSLSGYLKGSISNSELAYLAESTDENSVVENCVFTLGYLSRNPDSRTSNYQGIYRGTIKNSYIYKSNFGYFDKGALYRGKFINCFFDGTNNINCYGFGVYDDAEFINCTFNNFAFPDIYNTNANSMDLRGVIKGYNPLYTQGSISAPFYYSGSTGRAYWPLRTTYPLAKDNASGVTGDMNTYFEDGTIFKNCRLSVIPGNINASDPRYPLINSKIDIQYVSGSNPYLTSTSSIFSEVYGATDASSSVGSVYNLVINYPANITVEKCNFEYGNSIMPEINIVSNSMVTVNADDYIYENSKDIFLDVSANNITLTAEAQRFNNLYVYASGSNSCSLVDTNGTLIDTINDTDYKFIFSDGENIFSF